MTTRAQRVRVAVFAIAGLALVWIVLAVYGGMLLLRGHDRYYVEFEKTVYGLEPGGDVYLEGVRVGNVASMHVAQAGPVRVQVAIDVTPGTLVRSDTQAVLVIAGVTGLEEIDLRYTDTTGTRLPPGSTIPVGKSELDRLETAALSIADRSEALLGEAQRTLANLAALTSSDQLGAAIADARRVAGNLADTSAALRQLVDENRAALHGTIASIDQATHQASDLLSGQLTKLATHADQLVGQLDHIVTGTRGPLRETLDDLREASRSIKEMARQVQQNPSRLLFSHPPPERRLP